MGIVTSPEVIACTCATGGDVTGTGKGEPEQEIKVVQWERFPPKIYVTSPEPEVVNRK